MKRWQGNRQDRDSKVTRRPLSRRMRRRLRNGVIVTATLCCAALGAVGIRLVDVAINDSMGITAHDLGSMDQASRWFARNHILNHAQPWLAHYNSGTAAFGQQRWEDAEEHYRAALELAPGSHRCRVAINWAWTIEARGDALKGGGNLDDAQEAWARAKALLDEEHCPKPEKQDPEPDEPQEQPQQQDQAGNPDEPDSEPEQQREPTQRRIEHKQRSLEAEGQPAQDAPPPEGEAGDEQRAEELKRMQEHAAAEAMDARDRQEQEMRRPEPGEKREEPRDRPW